jgi:hypothetical protein
METPEIGTSAIEPSTKSRPSKFAWLWPVITNEEEAKKAAKSGAYGAMFIAVITCTLSLVGIATKEPFFGMNKWGMVDAFLFAVIAWRVFSFSFSWAVFGLLLYFAEICWRWSTVGPPKSGGIVTTGIIVLLLNAGVRGTAFLSNRENLSNNLRAPIIVIICAVAFAMFVAGSVRP